MAMTKRERVYDEEIAPLMAKIIATCKEHGIPMVFSAQLNDARAGMTDTNDDGDDLGPFFCTTILVGGDLFPDTHEKLWRAAAALRPRAASFAAYAIVDGVAERTGGSADGYDPGVAGTVRGKVML